MTLQLFNRKSKLPPAGLHTYDFETAAEKSRVHLRLDDDGHGLLLINANRALHLNPTAAILAWLILEETPQEEAIARLRNRFRVDARTAKADFERVQSQIHELIRPDGACPIHDLDLDLIAPFSKMPSAPYRMDLALTYRCNDNCAHCYNARPRDYPELDTQSWIAILEKLWQVGIPHVCFTGGEATLRADLPQLIQRAQSQGQITGLLSNGRRLSDLGYTQELVAAGLDHVQITVESHDPEIHDRMVSARGAWRQTIDGVRNALDSSLYVMTNTTLLTHNAQSILETIDFLAEIGVPTIGINALIYAGKGSQVGTGLPEAALPGLLESVRERTDHHGQRLIWYTPTQYCHFDPVQMELGVKGCTAARYNMCIEPDGGVIPCQSYYQQLGNILHDPWDSIWEHDLSRWLRERAYVPEECHACAFLPECGGGCPLTLQHPTADKPVLIEETSLLTADELREKI
jgi:radical SAM protein with 4Fe4S-binding SPASM domain